ncbi:MAG: bifunctional homocysteine S-methyltransferase/methylenetetrahydrofolate reductase [Anaerolineae bacterium]|nr:bifunctional homocysteine S-methyltransferase/methylenetetrahydrofolate reductase [Anaerolineae bacterium]
MTNRFLQQLDTRPLLCDGAMGTMIHSKGIRFERCFDELNLSQPALIADIHRAYIDAGADVIETNTFGANRFKLDEYRLADKVIEINQTAAQLARRVVEASFKEVFVAGSIGPLGARLAPLGRLSASEAHAAFQEQAAALVAGGVDLLLFETFADLLELREAIAAAREVSADIPLVAQVTFTQDGRTPLGYTPQKVAEQLAGLPVEVIGLNCSVGPADTLRSLQNLARFLPNGTRLSTQPNAGWPERVGGRIMYPAPPEYFGDYALAFIKAGARLVGGCCGTTPEHITHMRAALDNPTREVAHLLVPGDESAPVPTQDTVGATRLARQLAAGEFVIGVEMSPPKGFSAERLLAGAATLQAAGANAINLADSPRSRMRMSPWAMCHLLQSQLDMETVLHFPTRGRNILRVQGDLLAAHALNVRNIFVVMGDPTSIGEYPDALNEYDVVPTGLIKLLKQGFNQGFDYGDEPILQPTNFLVGCAVNLTPPDPERELKVLHRKIESGADFALSQPVYDVAAAKAFVNRYEAEYGPLKLHLLAGLLPLYNARHAEFLHNEVPGINIPPEIRQRIRSAGSNSAQAGLVLARELIAELRAFAHGIYLMPPFERFDLAAELIESVKQETPAA